MWANPNGRQVGYAVAAPTALEWPRASSQERPCCLDSSFSEPIRAKAVPDDFKSERLLLLFKRLLQDLLLSTNMLLEGTLSQIKAAVPRGKARGSVNAEKVSWLGLLAQTLHRHLQRGRRDCRSHEGRDTLLASGVPLEHWHAPGVSRPDKSWFWHQYNAWKSANTSASDTDSLGERRRLHSMWNNFSQAERLASVSLLSSRQAEREKEQAEKRRRKQQEPEEVDEALAPEDSFWDAGSFEWPLRPEILSEYLQSHCSNRSMTTAGLANKAHTARAAERHRLVIQDEACIQDSTVFAHRHHCSARHPGLCAERDLALYDEALLLGKNLETALGASCLHKFFVLVNAADDQARLPVRLACNCSKAVPSCLPRPQAERREN